MKTKINAIHRDSAETLWVVRDRMYFMGQLEGSNLSIVEVEVPPGSGTPPHTHASPEIFRVLTGEITFGIFEEGQPRQVVAQPGTVVTVPSHAGHNYANLSNEPASMMVVVDQSMIEFFRELGSIDAPPQGPPTEAEIAVIMGACDRHGIAVLGGPM